MGRAPTRPYKPICWGGPGHHPPLQTDLLGGPGSHPTLQTDLWGRARSPPAPTTTLYMAFAPSSFPLRSRCWKHEACLLWVCIFSLLFFGVPCGHVAYFLWVCIFYFFLYSPYIMMISLERDKHGTSWSFICGWMGDELAIFQV